VGGVPSISYDSNSTQTRITNDTVVDRIIFYDEETIQEKAYTNERNIDLVNCKNKTTNISYDPITSTTTLSNNVIINNLQSSQLDLKENIISGTNKLNPQFINSTGNSLTTQKVEYLSSIASDLQTQLNNLSNLINSLQSSDSSQASLNTSLSNGISSLQTSKNDVINNSNKLSSSLIDYSTSPLQYIDSGITTNLSTQLSGKQNTISTNSRLNTDVIEYGSGATTILTNQISNMVNNISTNTTDISTNSTNINSKANIDNPTFTGKIISPQLQITDGTFAAGKVLTDVLGNGNATWGTLPSTSSSLSIIYGTVVTQTLTNSGLSRNVNILTLPSGTFLVICRGLISAAGTITAFSHSLCSSAAIDVAAGFINDANGTPINTHLRQGISLVVNGTYTLPPVMVIVAGNQTVYYNMKITGTSFTPVSLACYAIKVA
jgi:hypothetical protein